MLSRRALIGMVSAASAAAIALAALRVARAPKSHVGAPSAPSWPSPESPLNAIEASFPDDFGVRRIAIDPGHGARDNKGNTSSFCVDEQDYTLAIARDLTRALEETGHFEVLITRPDSEPVEYQDRIADAEAWGADVFISLHSDVRGHSSPWTPAEGKTCLMSVTAPGFAILYSDEGDDELVATRRTLARDVARSMAASALLPYGGGYEGLYAADAETIGVFVDRHAMEQRIFVLRRAAMPSIIVETHNALDPREAVRWDETRTREVFGAAIVAALVTVLRNAS